VGANQALPADRGLRLQQKKLNGTLETAKFGNKDIHLDYTLHGPILGIGIHF
jgi:hypothetical protein